MPIEMLFDQVEDGMEYVAAGNNPKTPEQIVMTGQQLITETGMFTADIKMWKRRPEGDKTWVRFNMDVFIGSSRAQGKCGCWKYGRVSKQRGT